MDEKDVRSIDIANLLNGRGYAYIDNVLNEMAQVEQGRIDKILRGQLSQCRIRMLEFHKARKSLLLDLSMSLKDRLIEYARQKDFSFTQLAGVHNIAIKE